MLLILLGYATISNEILSHFNETSNNIETLLNSFLQGNYPSLEIDQLMPLSWVM